MKKIEKMEKIEDGVVKCYHADGEISYIGDFRDLLPLTGADSWQFSATGIVLGYKDEDGEIWYGGCDPSNFINIVSLERLGISESEVRTLGIKPQKWDGKDIIYIWRAEYPNRNLVQMLSAVTFFEEVE